MRHRKFVLLILKIASGEKGTPYIQVWVLIPFLDSETQKTLKNHKLFCFFKCLALKLTWQESLTQIG